MKLSQAVESSAINMVEYETETHVMTIEFKQNRKYDYPDVPREVYEGLIKAESKGKYYNKEIRGKYGAKI